MNAIQIYIKNKTYSNAGLRKDSTIENLKILLPANEFICLIGPSGCGKTTLLNIIAKLDTDFQGDVTRKDEAIQPKIAYIFQSPRLLPWHTVRKNIEIVLDKPQPEYINALLKDMRLDNIQHDYPAHLSLGMQRRVAIVRAFAVQPEILLMDEPFTSLDAPSIRQIRELLIKLWQHRPHTVVFVTHDLREAITLADRLIFLSITPMSVISEVKVDISKENRNNDKAVECFRQKLATDYPQINNLL